MTRVSEPTIGRLSIYLRMLEELDASGVETVSSGELAGRTGTTAAQVRKDLSHFGTFGKRGLGYAVAELEEQLRTILGLHRTWSVALVGAGRIGAALFGYESFREQGFYIEAVFDSDPAKVGERWDEQLVEPDAALEEVVKERGIKIGVIAVPVEAAQRAVDRLVSVGVRGILNFAPTQLKVPPDVEIKTVDMTVELEKLSYALTHGPGAD